MKKITSTILIITILALIPSSALALQSQSDENCEMRNAMVHDLCVELYSAFDLITINEIAIDDLESNVTSLNLIILDLTERLIFLETPPVDFTISSIYNSTSNIIITNGTIDPRVNNSYTISLSNPPEECETIIENHVGFDFVFYSSTCIELTPGTWTLTATWNDEILVEVIPVNLTAPTPPTITDVTLPTISWTTPTSSGSSPLADYYFEYSGTRIDDSSIDVWEWTARGHENTTLVKGATLEDYSEITVRMYATNEDALISDWSNSITFFP